MTVIGTSASSGAMEYLADGVDSKRFNENGEIITREMLDERICIDGDFDLTKDTIDYINETKDWKSSYYHEVLSFKEDDISDEKIYEIYNDAKRFLLAGYTDNEHAAYAEIHRPLASAKYKMKNEDGSVTLLSESQYIDICNNFPEKISSIEQRKIHVHMIIPKIDLQRDIQLKISERMGDEYTKIDKNNLQRYCDLKYGLNSWEDNFTTKETSSKEEALKRSNPNDERLNVSKKKENLINEISEKIYSNEITNFDELLEFVKNKDGLEFIDCKTKEKFPTQVERIKVRFDGETQDSNLRSSFFQNEFWKNKTLIEIKKIVKNDIENINPNDSNRQIGGDNFKQCEAKFEQYILKREKEVAKRNSFRNRELSSKLDFELREKALNFKYDLSTQTSKEKIIADLEAGKCVFLTGGAGVGKSYTTRLVIEDFESRNLHVMKLGSTGIAGMNIGGQTYHSKLMLGIETDFSKIKERDAKNPEKFEALKKEISNTDLIVFDEISMISGKQFDLIKARLDDLGYKGKILTVGDMAQLPAVEKSIHEAPKEAPDYIFKAEAWKNLNTQTHPLFEIKRSTDKEWSEVLNELRIGVVSENGKEKLDSLKNNQDFKEKVETVHLASTNAKVNEINQDYLDRLAGDEMQFETIVFDDEKDTIVNSKSLKAEIFDETYMSDVLKIKPDAIVMLRKNNPIDGYVNGDRAIFKGFSGENAILIMERTGQKLLIPKVDEKISIDNKSYTINNYPFVLAKAMTVHKSQGLGFDSAIIHLNNIFAKGQGYVAISRLTNFENSKIVFDDVVERFGEKKEQTYKDVFKVDNEIIDFINPNLRSKELKELDAKIKKEMRLNNQKFSDNQKVKQFSENMKNPEKMKEEIVKNFYRDKVGVKQKAINSFISKLEKNGASASEIEEFKKLVKDVKVEQKNKKLTKIEEVVKNEIKINEEILTQKAKNRL